MRACFGGAGGKKKGPWGRDRTSGIRKLLQPAAVEMHQDVGPANATISAIAERAGVQRLTVYRHFPDERALLSACSAHYAAGHPRPDPD
jgi:AcrR family transcriptional regulator